MAAPTSEQRESRGFALQVAFLILLLTGIAVAGRAMLARESTISQADAPSSEDEQDQPAVPGVGIATTKAPVETTEIFAEKDPFNAPIERKGNGGDDETEDEVDAGPLEGDFPPAPADDPGAPVAVVNVTEGSARVAVDGAAHDVHEGEIFADHFQLLLASGRCATLLYGDDQFSLCEGQEILR